MYPAAFEYHRAKSVDEALAMMEQYGDEAKLLAGGHSLLPLMKLRFASPGHLIDISRIAAMSGISESGGKIVIGAMTRHTDVGDSDLIAGHIAALSDAARAIGDVQVRNCGTIGGSVAHADPGADLPAVMLALHAEIVVTGASGERIIPADEYFTGTFETSLREREIVTQIRIAIPPKGSESAYEKYADRASGYALTGVAALVTVADGKIASASVALTGLAAMVTRLSTVEKALAGSETTAESVKEACRSAGDGLELYDDARGSAEYKANLARVYAFRAVSAALERATT